MHNSHKKNFIQIMVYFYKYRKHISMPWALSHLCAKRLAYRKNMIRADIIFHSWFLPSVFVICLLARRIDIIVFAIVDVLSHLSYTTAWSSIILSMLINNTNCTTDHLSTKSRLGDYCPPLCRTKQTPTMYVHRTLFTV